VIKPCPGLIVDSMTPTIIFSPVTITQVIINRGNNNNGSNLLPVPLKRTMKQLQQYQVAYISK
jgi:hypothetical protein